MTSSFAKTPVTSVFAKAPQEDAGPYLSLNPKITDPNKLSEEPTAEVKEQMKNTDPKLSSTWTIWEQHKPPKDKKSGDFADAIKKTVDFSTVKEFWGCWNHLPHPSELLESKKFVREGDGGQRAVIDCFAVFRQGVRPQWEDEQNTRGGHFELKLKPSLPGGLIDELWNNTVMGMIIGAIEPAEMLTGVRLVDKLDNRQKPCIRIELWFNEYDEDTLKGCQGKVYSLRGSFESCIRIGLDGREKPVSWGRTETIAHQEQGRR